MNHDPSQHHPGARSSTMRAAAALFAIAFILTLTLAPPTTMAQASPAAATVLSTTTAGVIVTVTSLSLGEGGRPLEFRVVLDTHTGELADDLLQTATLTLADGRKFKPARWTGFGPGGHHREGVLSFDVPDAGSGPVELAITRPGESPRSYRWQR